MFYFRLNRYSSTVLDRSVLLIELHSLNGSWLISGTYVGYMPSTLKQILFTVIIY